jgi:hypothetical protein
LKHLEKLSYCLKLNGRSNRNDLKIKTHRDLSAWEFNTFVTGKPEGKSILGNIGIDGMIILK